MSAQPATAYLGISEVLARLRPEFPDITVSKIRFLESEGLIAPARSPSRYRRFSPADVDRLRYILTAQRDQYLPLRVIRERLARPGQSPAAQLAPPAGSTPAPAARTPSAQPPRSTAPRSTVPRSTAAQPAGSTAQPAGSAPDQARLSRRELIEAAGIDADQLTELESFGLVRRSGRLYGPAALDAAVTVAALADYGVRARHLRPVLAAAERDISLIEQVVAPTLRQRNPEAVRAAGQAAGQIAAALLRLHQALVEAALAEAGLPYQESYPELTQQAPAGRAAAEGASA